MFFLVTYKRDEETIDVSRLMIPLGLIPCMVETMSNGSGEGDENFIERALEIDNQQQNNDSS